MYDKNKAFSPTKYTLCPEKWKNSIFVSNFAK